MRYDDPRWWGAFRYWFAAYVQADAESPPVAWLFGLEPKANRDRKQEAIAAMLQLGRALPSTSRDEPPRMYAERIGCPHVHKRLALALRLSALGAS